MSWRVVMSWRRMVHSLGSDFTEVEYYEYTGNCHGNDDKFKLVLTCEGQPLTVDGVEREKLEIIFTGGCEVADFLEGVKQIIEWKERA